MGGESQKPHERVPRSYEDLRGMSDDDLLEQLRYQGSHLGRLSFDFWPAEVERRHAERDRAQQARLTGTMTRLTWAVAMMTGLVLACTAVQIFILLLRT